jgi:hypothetical protein
MDEPTSQMIMHYSTDGFILHREDEEANIQTDVVNEMRDKAKELAKTEDDADADKDLVLDDATLRKALRNQFNYCKRSAQGVVVKICEGGYCTKPPETNTFYNSINRYVM